MPPSQKSPRKHHFVPRSLLRYFKAPGPDEYMFTFDKRTRTRFRASLMDTGSQNNYNTLDLAGEPVNFENEYDAVDALLAGRLANVHSLRMDALRTPQDRADWMGLVAVQLLRTPIVRSTQRAFVTELSSWTEELFGEQATIPTPTENDCRRIARSLFHERDDVVKSLGDKDLVLVEATGREMFRISDRPVCISNPDPYGDLGLASPSVTIFMPLGPQLLLALLSPNLRYRLNRRPIEKLDLPADTASNLIALRTALSTGNSLPWDDVDVRRHNALQISHSSRFIYGPTDDFSDVLAIMDANAGVGEVQSFMRVGAGPPSTMPSGHWLVLFGRRDSYMLPVVDAVNGWPFEATVSDEASLALALDDGPFSEMRYIVDGHVLCSLREVAAERSSAQAERLTFRHTNDSLNALMDAIDRQR
jgi:hypothetical protein